MSVLGFPYILQLTGDDRRILNFFSHLHVCEKESSEPSLKVPKKLLYSTIIMKSLQTYSTAQK